MHTTIQGNSRAGVSWESTDTGGTQGDRGDEDAEVRVLGNLAVAPHEAGVDILAVGEGRFAADQVLETSDDLTAVVEDGVGDGSGIDGKERAILEDHAGGEVSWRVCLIALLVEQRGVLVDDPQDVVTRTSVIPNVVIVDGDVSRVPRVGIPNYEDDRGGDERPEETVEGTIEWVNEGVYKNGKLVPVPGREEIEAKTANTASDCSQVDVVRGNPSHPVEVGHGLDDVAWEPEVDEHSTKTVHEPPHPRDRPAVDDSVGLGMEDSLREARGRDSSRIPISAATYVQCDSGQVGWPNGTRWVYEESAGKASKTVSNKIG
jgi:hypothetical protein